MLALSAYLALAVAYSWPLPANIGTHLTGSPGGDAGAYVWNQWLFRSELLAGNHWPFRTDKILSLTEPADLSLHNYTIFADLLSLLLQDRFGLVASFNLIYLALRVGSAYAMFLLAQGLLPGRAEAFLAGLLFGFSPFMTARGTAHFSLVAAAPLPLFVFFLWRAGRDMRLRWSIAAGLTAGWAVYCDPYYLVYCVLILAAALGYAAFRIDWSPRQETTHWKRAARALEIIAASSGLLWLGIAISGGGRFTVLGRGVSLVTLYTPALVLLLSAMGRLLVSIEPAVSWRRELRFGATLRQLAAGGSAAAVLASPLLLALLLRILDGRFVSPSTPWRSSPPGVDLLAFLMPNPSHGLFGEPLRRWLARQRPDGFVENAASLTLVALFVVLLALWKRAPLPRAWVAFTLFFTLLSLGPFVSIGGFNTGVPTPWTLLRYVPGVSMANSPTRFAIVAMLGFALLFAAALKEMGARMPKLRSGLLVAVGLVLVFELAPLPRQLHAAEVPGLYSTIASDPCDVRVLELPFGLRDGTHSVGNFSARTQFHQTGHGKPLFGGYLSRISQRRTDAYRRLPVMNALLTLSEDRPLTPEDAERARRAAPRFLKRARIGFVVINRTRASRKLRRFAISTLGLVRLDQQWPRELLVPNDSVCEAQGRACGHSSAGCALRREAQGALSSKASGDDRAERSTGRGGPSDR